MDRSPQHGPPVTNTAAGGDDQQWPTFHISRAANPTMPWPGLGLVLSELYVTDVEPGGRVFAAATAAGGDASVLAVEGRAGARLLRADAEFADFKKAVDDAGDEFDISFAPAEACGPGVWPVGWLPFHVTRPPHSRELGLILNTDLEVAEVAHGGRLAAAGAGPALVGLRPAHIHGAAGPRPLPRSATYAEFRAAIEAAGD
eukprot:gene48494-8049_t